MIICIHIQPCCYCCCSELAYLWIIWQTPRITNAQLMMDSKIFLNKLTLNSYKWQLRNPQEARNSHSVPVQIQLRQCHCLLLQNDRCPAPFLLFTQPPHARRDLTMNCYHIIFLNKLLQCGENFSSLFFIQKQARNLKRLVYLPTRESLSAQCPRWHISGLIVSAQWPRVPEPALVYMRLRTMEPLAAQIIPQLFFRVATYKTNPL